MKENIDIIELKFILHWKTKIILIRVLVKKKTSYLYLSAFTKEKMKPSKVKK